MLLNYQLKFNFVSPGINGVLPWVNFVLLSLRKHHDGHAVSRVYSAVTFCFAVTVVGHRKSKDLSLPDLLHDSLMLVQWKFIRFIPVHSPA